jgi:tRNA pseudouridine38-40 synthase
VEYVGTNFHGWQTQSNGKTIQKTIEQKIKKIINEKVKLIGSGRTDSGVHALEQSAHFDCKKKIENLNKFVKSINYFLNDNLISILSIKKRNLYFHARYSAKKRIYKYIIFNRNSKPSIYKERGWHVSNKLDISLMRKGAKKLLGTNDYSTYRASSCNAKSPIKSIKLIKIRKSNNIIYIKFQSQSFLQQQVRSMVGCLKYLGEGKWNLKKFTRVFKAKKRILCAPPAPPNGLYLEKVIY